MNPILNQLADGRRMAARSIVLNTLSSIPAVVYRRHTAIDDKSHAAPVTDGYGWDDVAISEMDETDYDYQYQGHAMVLFDRWTGGGLLKNDTGVLGADTASMAQIEPYDEMLQGREQLLQVPVWVPQTGDLFGLLLDPKLIVWLELVDSTGQTMMGDFGRHYVLNRRDDFSYKQPFEDDLEQRRRTH